MSPSPYTQPPCAVSQGMGVSFLSMSICISLGTGSFTSLQGPCAHCPPPGGPEAGVRTQEGGEVCREAGSHRCPCGRPPPLAGLCLPAALPPPTGPRGPALRRPLPPASSSAPLSSGPAQDSFSPLLAHAVCSMSAPLDCEALRAGPRLCWFLPNSWHRAWHSSPRSVC